MHGPMLIMTKQVTYKHNIQAPLHNKTCRGITTNIRDSNFVSVALVIHHAKRICPIILSPATSLAVQYFSTVPQKLHCYRKKKINEEMTGFILIFCATFFWNISLPQKSACLYVQRPLFFQILTNFEFSQQIFENHSNTEFHENSSCGSRVVACG